MEQSTKTEPTSETTADNGPMFMVVTLKNGVQIRSRVTEYTVRRNGLGALIGIEWSGNEDTDTSIEYLDMDEVASVHTEWTSE